MNRNRHPLAPLLTRAAVAAFLHATHSHAACGQTPLFHFTLTLTEVHAGTATPVASPNGLIEPGEGVLFELTSLLFEPGVGTVVQTPVGPGPVAGLGAFHAVLWGVGGAEGQWSNIYRAPAWTGLGGPPIPAPGGTTLSPLLLAQWPYPTINTQNPIENAIRAEWTPSSYTPRTVTWIFEGGGHTGWGSLFVHVGTDPTTGLPQYQTVSVPHHSFTGNRLNEVHIVPSPPGAPLAILVAAGACRRRRGVRSMTHAN